MIKHWKTVFHGYLLVLVLLLVWCVWRAAAQGTNEALLKDEAAAAVVSQSGSTNTVIVRTGHAGMETPAWIKRLSNDLPFLTHQWFGNEIWKYLFSLIYIFLAFYVSKLLDFLTRVWLKKWTEKTETKFDDLLLELLNGPIKVVIEFLFGLLSPFLQ